jgi:late competence protein required for DNA uptake (superfamily II DNA/RNA helicase)
MIQITQRDCTPSSFAGTCLGTTVLDARSSTLTASRVCLCFLRLPRRQPRETAVVGASEAPNFFKVGYRDGRYRTLVSARVLNEGMDVPEAHVAIIVAGRFGVREHIQRIGRVLRPAPGKVATVYELVTSGTVDDARARARGRRLAARGIAGV